MAFRYLIYSTGTSFAETIVRESAVDDPGVNEASLFTDFVIPAIQPLYLWRVTGGTTVVPNTDSNIEEYLDATVPPDPDDPLTLAEFTGYTAVTQITIDAISGATEDNAADIAYISGVTDNNFSIFQTFTAQTTADLSFISGATDQNTNDIAFLSGETDNKVDKVTGVTDQIATFTVDGNIEGSGFTIDDIITGITSGATIVTKDEFTGYTATTEVRLQDIEADIQYLSGETSGNTVAISGLTEDIQFLSGVTSGLTESISGITDDINYISGVTDNLIDDINFISGVTDTKLDTSVFNTYTGDTRTELDLTITGATNGLNKVGRDVLLGGTLTQNTSITGLAGTFDLEFLNLNAFNLSFDSVSTITDNGANGGLRYAGDYAPQFVDRSLVDKGYVDALVQGLDLKESVRVATTTGETDIDLGGGTFGGVIDGYTLQDGDRALIKNQDSAQEENGIYVWSTGTNTFARAVDFENPFVTSGAFTFVETGTTNQSSGWVLVTQDPISVGTTPLVFTKFSEAGNFTAGVGIDITSNVISFDGAAVAGDFLQWTGTQLNVTGLTTQSDFNSFTAETENNFTFISGVTDQNTNDIQFLSGVTSGLTDGLSGITEDINYISGVTDNIIDDINFISGVTDTKLDTDIFTGYTAETQSNELFIVHTGGTDLNQVVPVDIPWQSGITVGSAYTYTGGTVITINETAEYEVSYNIPFNQTNGNSDRGIGANIVVNGNIIDLTAAAAFTSRVDMAGSVSLPTVNLSLNSGDKLSVIAFRTAQGNTVLSSPTGSLLIKKKGTLQ